ncbi:MAG TPA: M28 family peptidase [Pyrinomonadaceae bacterium]
MNKTRLLIRGNASRMIAGTNFIIAVLLVASLNMSVMPQRPRRPATRGAQARGNATMPAGISENTLRAHIKYLSDDLLEGRGPGTRGGELAAKYVAAQFEALGLRGGGQGGSFYQPVALVGVNANPKPTLEISGNGKKETFKFADDFVAFTGAQTENVSVNADLVFVGYGIESPGQRWNDYKGDADDYRNKILVMLVNDPPATESEPNLFGGRALTYTGRWTYKFEEAARRGAAGAILLHTDESAGYPWSVVRTSNGSWRYDIARGANDRTPFLKLRSWMTNDAAERMMHLAGQDLGALRRQAATRDFQPVKLNLKASIDMKNEVKRVEAPNVAAVIQGSDPRLRDEYVIFSAHWDHLGIGAPNKNGDTIYNGAQDNATGVAAMIGIAEAIMKWPPQERPRRSIMFLITTAEEQGLLGSEWYSTHPLVPVAKTAANVNLDSLNILGPTHDFAPLGADRSSLEAVVQAVARDRGMRVAPDPRPEQGSFYRSDHFPFAKVGVPSISLKEGQDFIGRPKGWGEEKFKAYNTANYHQPSDEYSDTWDFRGLVQEAEIALDIARRVADSPELPRFNADDEFARAQPNRGR